MSGPRKNGMTWAEVVYFSWRDLGIYLAREDGMKLQEIGNQVGLSGERVRQILAKGNRKRIFAMNRAKEIGESHAS